MTDLPLATYRGLTLLQLNEAESEPLRMSKVVWAAAVGATVGFAFLLGSWGLALGSSSCRQVTIALNYPVILFLDWYADTFENGNTDHMLGPWLLLFPAFWILVGATGGTLGYFLCSRLARSARSEK